MNLHRTSESGLIDLTALDAAEIDGLAEAILRGRGGELGGRDLLFLTRTVGEGTATALAVDGEGSVVVVTAVDGEVGSDAVTTALRDASGAAARGYDDLDEAFEGEGTLRDAHADYFGRESLDTAAFNADQRVRLLAPAFDPEALDLATFLSRKELSVTPVRVDAFDAGDGEFLVRFGTPAEEAETEAVAAAESATGDDPDADDSAQWVAGGDEAGDGTAVAAAVSEGRETDTEPVVSSDESKTSKEEELDAVATVSEPSGGSAGDPTETVTEDGDAAVSEEAGDAVASDDATDGGTVTDDVEPGGGTDDAQGSEPLDRSTLLEAVSEGVRNRLVGTFQGDVDELVSVERGNELLIRPDHDAYASGVLRYRLTPDADGGVDFEVNIYGGSEAEKEQMRAVIRSHEAAIEEELGYTVADRYNGLHGHEAFDRLDRDAATAIVDEFDRLVRFFHPRAMRSWRDSR